MLFAIVFSLSLSLSVATQCRVNPYVHHFTLGEINATIVSDGPIRLPSNFFSVPDVAVARSYARLSRPTDPLVWQQNIALFDTPNGRVLIDTGVSNNPAPPFADAGQLQSNLASIGVDPASIDAVLLTHGHPDHVSGLINADGGKAFPNAKIFVTRIEHQFWMAEPFVNPNPAAAILENFAMNYKRVLSVYNDSIMLVEDEERPIRGFRYILSPGHSPGHAAIVVKSDSARLFCVGDTWFSQPDQVRNPEWTRPVETNAIDGFNTRVALMDRLSRSGDLVLAFHEDFPGLGYIVRTPESYDWIPARNSEVGTVQKTC